MNIKENKELFKEAINSGCQTMAQLAHFLKLKTMIKSK